MTLRQMRAFDAVAEVGSFTAAAAKLHLTQSALSVLVRELERELGTRLFDRHTRRILLTDAGQEFLPRARRVLAEVDTAAQRMAELRDKQRGRLRIAAPQMMASTLIARTIAEYLVRHPQIDVQLDDTLTDQLVGRVLDGSVDVAVGVDVPSNAEVARQTIFRDRHWLVCPPTHRLAAKRQVRWDELQHESFIAPVRDFMKWLAPALARHGLTIEPTHTSAYMTTGLGLAAAGLGVTVIPTYGASLVKAWGLTMLPLVAPVFERDVQIYALPGRSQSPATQAFVELLMQQLPLKRAP